MDSYTDEQRPTNRLRFDKTITLGHLLISVTIVIGMLTAWFKMEGRVSTLESLVSEDHALVLRDNDLLVQVQINDQKLSTLLDLYGQQLANINASITRRQ